MAALRWAALNLWSSHDTARDDPPTTTTDDEASASESDDSVTRSLPPLEAPTTLDGAAFRPPTEPNVDDAAGAWDLHDEPECPVCLEPWAVGDPRGSQIIIPRRTRDRAPRRSTRARASARAACATSARAARRGSTAGARSAGASSRTQRNAWRSSKATSRPAGARRCVEINHSAVCEKRRENLISTQAWR